MCPLMGAGLPLMGIGGAPLPLKPPPPPRMPMSIDAAGGGPVNAPLLLYPPWPTWLPWRGGGGGTEPPPRPCGLMPAPGAGRRVRGREPPLLAGAGPEVGWLSGPEPTGVLLGGPPELPGAVLLLFSATTGLPMPPPA